MCTVTFIPQGDTCFITSNRDENPTRKAERLVSIHHAPGNTIHFPIDSTSGGSWIALSDTGRAICLLNGAFEKFIPKPPYRLSRGEVVIAATNAPDAEKFLNEYPLSEIAPFTLLMYDDNRFYQWVWDGNERFITSLPTDQPNIWSSVTLYPTQVRQWRKTFFNQWLQEAKSFDRESIIQFHQQANGDPHNGFIMNRNEIVKTLSITSIQLKNSSGSILHLDLEHQQREEILVHYER